MKVNANDVFDFEQLDLFDEPKTQNIDQENIETPWDLSRGRDYIQALSKNGSNVTLFFDHLDQQYHLMEE